MSITKKRPSNFGRKEMFTSDTNFNNLESLVLTINNAMKVHRDNVADMNILLDYYGVEHSILTKEKEIRDNINNKIVVSLGYRAVEEVINYTLSNPVTYVSRTSKYQEELTKINDANNFESKSSIDQDVARWMLITGLGYRAVFPEAVEDPDEQPFFYDAIDPRSCFIIKNTALGNKPVLAVILNSEIVEENGAFNKYTIYNVYSNSRKWVFKLPESQGDLTVENYINPAMGNYQELQVLNTLPIQEFTYNSFRTGFFEVALDILDAIDMNTSLTLDDIEQKINSKLILLGVDPVQLNEVETDEEGNPVGKTFGEKVKDSEVIVFTGQQGINQDAKFISSVLDYSGSGESRDWLEDMFYYVLGLPERQNTISGSDTGTAVELRNGWQSLDGTARSIETRWYGSERESLKRVVKIMKTSGVIRDITVTDIDIKFSRNKLNNLLVKTQSAQTLAQTGLFDPTDIISIVDITTSPAEMAKRGQEYQLSEIAKKIREAQNPVKTNVSSESTPETNE